jgi:hypothetical protein
MLFHTKKDLKATQERALYFVWFNAASQGAQTAKHSSGINVEQTVQFNLDLCVRGLATCRDEVDDEPCKAPVRYPAPYRAEFVKDAVAPLKVRAAVVDQPTTHAAEILLGCRLSQRSHASPSCPLPRAL